MLQELVLLATKDMISLMEFVNSHHSTMLSLQTMDAPNGIGIIKFVSNAQKIGSSMLIMFVFQLVTNVLPMMPVELVSHASRDTI